METSTGQLVLSIVNEIREEVHALRAENAQWRSDFGERLATAETKIQDVVGNGQPGRLKHVEDAIASLLGYRYWLFGAAATAGIVAGIIGWAFPRH